MIEKIKCSECGAVVDIDENGNGICSHCGSKYKEKKNVTNIKNVSNNVNIIQTDKLNYDDININNYVEILRHDYSSENYEHAEIIANKILETSSALAEVWFIKGVSVGYQSTTVNPRLKEAYYCLTRANEIDDENYSADKIYFEFLSLARALIELASNQMLDYVSENSARTLVENIKLSQTYLIKFSTYSNNDLEDTYYIVHSNLERAFMSAQEDFGPDKSDKTRYAFETFIGRCSAITSVINSLINIISIDAVCLCLMELAIEINEETINSCSYKFDGISSVGILDIPIYVRDSELTADAIAQRRTIIAKYHVKINEIKQRAIANYWEEHKDKKEQIDKTISTLNNKLEHEKQQYKSLGFFAFSKKIASKKIMKELNSKIEILKKELTKDRI